MKAPAVPHIHEFDEQGRQICCTQEEKIQTRGLPIWRRDYLPPTVSFLILIVGIAFDSLITPAFFKGNFRLLWYLAAYIPVAWPVIVEGIRAGAKGNIFTEFSLMALATVGAFLIGEFPEGVAVMLFYAVGELFQSSAVRRAKGSIQSLLDVRPDRALVRRGGDYVETDPANVEVGETVRVRPGERVPLDGTLLGSGNFDTAALTGESRPQTLQANEAVLAGMISLDSIVDLRVSKPAGDSSIARILEMVQNAVARKAPTELFIRKFAKVYTPFVFATAVLLVVAPYFLAGDYSLRVWLYRALVFLVIACPCALVISIPLGYFGGIGAGSRNGLLFKGSNFLDVLAGSSIVVMDKTGTLTEGVFQVQTVRLDPAATRKGSEVLRLAAALEENSTHPVARALIEYVERKGIDFRGSSVVGLREIAGHGLTGNVDGVEIVAGNTRLLSQQNISYPADLDDEEDTLIAIAAGGRFTMAITIADQLKEGAARSVAALHEAGVHTVAMLSGDRQAVVTRVADSLGIKKAFGDLLPDGKVKKLEELRRQNPDEKIVFVGDGINDAPVLASADAGMAMGGLGSDAAIETADVVIQTDQPGRIATAIRIGRRTRRVVWQNIVLAFGVKALVLILGAGGLATMWEAVFADVGVSLLAILNAMRLQRMRFPL